jgi:hypothetical protein
MARRTHDFQTIRSEGGLLPPDLLRRVLDPKEKLPGTRPEDYGLPTGERPNEVITQSWNRLRKHWAEFRAAAANLPEGEAGTGLTNDKWSLPLLRELGFGLLPTSAGPEIGGRSYAISRFFGPVPVHLVGCGLSLDRRAAGQRGAEPLVLRLRIVVDGVELDVLDAPVLLAVVRGVQTPSGIEPVRLVGDRGPVEARARLQPAAQTRERRVFGERARAQLGCHRIHGGHRVADNPVNGERRPGRQRHQL